MPYLDPKFTASRQDVLLNVPGPEGPGGERAKLFYTDTSECSGELLDR